MCSSEFVLAVVHCGNGACIMELGMVHSCTPKCSQFDPWKLVFARYCGYIGICNWILITRDYLIVMCAWMFVEVQVHN